MIYFLLSCYKILFYFNKCYNCGKIGHNKCSNCINTILDEKGIISKKVSRNKCKKCFKYLENCDNCTKKFFCGVECYMDSKNKLIQKYNKVIKKINITNIKNDVEDNLCLNFNNEKNFFLCEMFECDECYFSSLEKVNSDIEIIPLSIRSIRENKNNYLNKNENCNNKIIQANDTNIHLIDKKFENNLFLDRNKSLLDKNNLSNTILNNNENIILNINNIKINEDNGLSADNKNPLNKESHKLNSRAEDMEPNKKEKITCLSMCILF